MTSPEWQQAIFERDDCVMADKLLLKVYAQMSDFPDIMIDLRRYHTWEVPFERVQPRVQAMADALEAIEQPLQAILEDPVQVRKRAASSWLSPVQEVYEAGTFLIPRVACFHAISTICALSMLEALVGDPTHELEARSYAISKRIWMFHEQATEVGSLGMHYYPTALLLTYGSAKSEEMKDWIIDLLNSLLARNPETDVMFTHEEVLQRRFALSGRLPVDLGFYM